MVAYHIVLPLLQMFMCLFENSAGYNGLDDRGDGWDDRDKSTHLRASLRGGAAQLLWGRQFLLQGICSEVEEEMAVVE